MEIKLLLVNPIQYEKTLQYGGGGHYAPLGVS